ncbi:MAG: AAA family ATPase [Rhodoferax sp.]|jgi:nicotinamide riboside kinase
MKAARLICIIGAESTGKTTLAQALARHFDCPWVPEYLRQFCHENARTPRRDEQALVIQRQRETEIAALARATARQDAFVFCDTAPLLTAIYSDFIFGDKSLLEQGRSLQANYALTLLLAPDIAWIADGLQRDGEHVRAPVHNYLQHELAALALPIARIEGTGDKRLANALEAVHRL